MAKNGWLDGRARIEAVDMVAEHEHIAVPEVIARTRFLLSALIWGWVWALAHRLWAWAAADFALSSAVLVTGVFAADPKTWPLTAFAFLFSAVGWGAFRIYMARRSPVEAWKRRAFRDVREFRAVQATWVVWAAVIVLGGILMAFNGRIFNDLIGPVCGPVG